jgi:hypothetical protein
MMQQESRLWLKWCPLCKVCQTIITVMLMVTSDLDPHIISGLGMVMAWDSS